MMTYQHDYGKPFVIPIFSWYIEGDKKIFIDTGEFKPRTSSEIEKSIGKVYTFEEGLEKYGLKPVVNRQLTTW